jgi:hypothetical protein
MPVAGLVVPCGLETEAQVIFDWYSGFGRGFERNLYRLGKQRAAAVVGHTMLVIAYHLLRHGTGYQDLGPSLRRT